MTLFTYTVRIQTSKRVHFRKTKADSKDRAVDYFVEKCEKANFPYIKIEPADPKVKICDCGRFATHKKTRGGEWFCGDCINSV
jgi:hypothetical protein